MKHFLLAFLLFIVGCGSSSKGPTSIQGSWTIVASNGAGGSTTFQASVVSSPCTVTTPIGTFTVAGPTCFIADNNTGQGSITGTGQFIFPPVGALVGVPVDPAPAGSALNLLFVEADQSGNAAVFGGNGTVTGNKMTGTWACDPSSPNCSGLSGTFSGNKQ